MRVRASFVFVFCFILSAVVFAAPAWQQLVGGGLGDANNTDAWAMAVYGGDLYVGTGNGATGAEVWV